MGARTSVDAKDTPIFDRLIDGETHEAIAGTLGIGRAELGLHRPPAALADPPEPGRGHGSANVSTTSRGCRQLVVRDPPWAHHRLTERCRFAPPTPQSPWPDVAASATLGTSPDADPRQHIPVRLPRRPRPPPALRGARRAHADVRHRPTRAWRPSAPAAPARSFTP
jgi:hypothetical protein